MREVCTFFSSCFCFGCVLCARSFCILFLLFLYFFSPFAICIFGCCSFPNQESCSILLPERAFLPLFTAGSPDSRGTVKCLYLWLVYLRRPPLLKHPHTHRTHCSTTYLKAWLSMRLAVETSEETWPWIWWSGPDGRTDGRTWALSGGVRGVWVGGVESL